MHVGKHLEQGTTAEDYVGIPWVVYVVYKSEASTIYEQCYVVRATGPALPSMHHLLGERNQIARGMKKLVNSLYRVPVLFSTFLDCYSFATTSRRGCRSRG